MSKRRKLKPQRIGTRAYTLQTPFKKIKDGKEIPKPSMNDINFESSYNPNWNVDTGDWEVQKWED